MDSVQERTTANKVIVIFVLVIIINVFTITAGIWHYTSFVAGSEGLWLATANVEQSIQVYNFLALMQIVLYIAALFVFCIWIHGVYEDLPALGATNLSYTPGRVVLGFFIPIFNFIHSFLVTTEVWKASEPDTQERQKIKNSSTVVGWWGFFIFSFALSLVGVFTFAINQKMAKISIIAGDGFAIFSAVLGILMVIRVEKRQELKYQCSIGKGPEKAKETPSEKIELWNPKAALAWSFILTPVFGTTLLIKNWRTLQQEEKAENLYIWNFTWIICFVLVLLIPADFEIKPYALLFFAVFFVFWGFLVGKPHIHYVQKEYGENYFRKKWGPPFIWAMIAIGMGTLFGFFVNYLVDSLS